MRRGSSSVTYSAEQVYTILTGLGLDTDEIPNAPAGWFGEGVLDSAGYVAQMPVCGQVFTGTRLRSAFSLRSAAFTVAYDAGRMRLFSPPMATATASA